MEGEGLVRATAVLCELAKFHAVCSSACADLLLFLMATRGGGNRGEESGIAAGSASATGVSLAVGRPSGSGVCGLNYITNVIHGGVTATVLSSSVPRLVPNMPKKFGAE